MNILKSGDKFQIQRPVESYLRNLRVGDTVQLDGHLTITEEGVIKTKKWISDFGCYYVTLEDARFFYMDGDVVVTTSVITDHVV